jgi:hypothetical protein
MPTAFVIKLAVQWVVSAGGSVRVSATTRSATPDLSGGMREGRVLSRKRPPYPSCMKRSCQRQTQVFDLPVWHMISLVPTPSALSSTILARHMLLRCVTIPRERLQTTAVTGPESDGNSGSHRPDSHAASPAGIPSRIQISDLIH